MHRFCMDRAKRRRRRLGGGNVKLFTFKGTYLLKDLNCMTFFLYKQNLLFYQGDGFTIFHFDLVNFINKNCKYIFSTRICTFVA